MLYSKNSVTVLTEPLSVMPVEVAVDVAILSQHQLIGDGRTTRGFLAALRPGGRQSVRIMTHCDPPLLSIP